jgi:isopenicillin-N epimerase
MPQPAELGHAALSHWGLRADMVFLNHGSYGATPLALLQKQRDWQDRLERQPVAFINDEMPAALRSAAAALAEFVGTTPDSLALVENTTCGIGAILRSLQLGPDDEIVLTDHIYNAVRQTLVHVCAQTGARMRIVALGMPVASGDEIAALLRAAIGPAVRLVCLDHVASASAVVMPVAEVAAHCRELGVPLLVDGAHAPGMLTLDLDGLDPDYYVGNCHKWLCTPKGAAFLRVAVRARVGLHPLAISHAYGAGFPDEFYMVGTRDASAQLTVPEAIAFHQALGGAALRARNHALAVTGGALLAERLGTRCGAPPDMFGAMATVELPASLSGALDRPAANALKARLWAEHRIEVHVMPFDQRLWLRICTHAYNEISDIQALADRLAGWAAQLGEPRA